MLCGVFFGFNRINSGIIELDETSEKFSKNKFNNIYQEDLFVRFSVSGKNDLCFYMER